MSRRLLGSRPQMTVVNQWTKRQCPGKVVSRRVMVAACKDNGIRLQLVADGKWPEHPVCSSSTNIDYRCR